MAVLSFRGFAGDNEEEAARDPDSTVIEILYLACQSLRPEKHCRGAVLVFCHGIRVA